MIEELLKPSTGLVLALIIFLSIFILLLISLGEELERILREKVFSGV